MRQESNFQKKTPGRRDSTLSSAGGLVLPATITIDPVSGDRLADLLVALPLGSHRRTRRQLLHGREIAQTFRLPRLLVRLCGVERVDDRHRVPEGIRGVAGLDRQSPVLVAQGLDLPAVVLPPADQEVADPESLAREGSALMGPHLAVRVRQRLHLGDALTDAAVPGAGEPAADFVVDDRRVRTGRLHRDHFRDRGEERLSQSEVELPTFLVGPRLHCLPDGEVQVRFPAVDLLAAKPAEQRPSHRKVIEALRPSEPLPDIVPRQRLVEIIGLRRCHVGVDVFGRRETTKRLHRRDKIMNGDFALPSSLGPGFLGLFGQHRFHIEHDDLL